MKKAYHYNFETNLFDGESEVFLVEGYDDYMLPAFATWQPVPELAEGDQARFNGEQWNIEKKPVPITAYNKLTQEAKEFSDASEIGDLYTLEQPPSKYHTFVDGWVITEEAAKAQLSDAVKESKTLIDNAYSLVTSRFTPMIPEYTSRELEALAVKDGKEAGIYLSSYADAVGIPVEHAADIVLQQAKGLHQAKAALSALRMQKFTLDKMNTVDEVKAKTSELIAKIHAIGEQI